MYKLVIADDEQFIREGLRDIMDWDKLGFELIAVFEDGEQIIEYIQDNDVDVILTDIKMTKKSGLDVAKFVYENKPQTKIILISGYKEIDLAMSAIKFNVQEYVLKPVDIDILTSSFNKVKQLLDKEYEAYYNTIALEAMEKSLVEIKDNFFSELITSSFNNEHYVKSMFKFLYPKLDIKECTCFLLLLSIEDYDDFIKNRWTHTSSDLYSCLKNCISLSSSSIIEYRMITKKLNHLQVIGIITSRKNNPLSKRHELISTSGKNLCKQLKETLCCNVKIIDIEIYDNIWELLQHRNKTKDNNVNESLMMKINELQKMICSTICAGNLDSISSLTKQFAVYIDGINDTSTMQALTANLLITIKNKLLESSADILKSALCNDWDRTWNTIYTLTSATDIQSFLANLFKDLISHIRKANIDNFDIIEQAKKYIMDNITKDFSLEDISEKFYISQYYFSRMFKEKTGENFIDFVVRNKMEYAMELLKMPQYKIYEISNKIGYKSIRYFTKTFKKYTGYTPTAYRKLLSIGQENKLKWGKESITLQNV